MKVLGTAFAILTGGLMVTGAFITGLICGAGLMIEKEKRDRDKDHWKRYTVNFHDNYTKRDKEKDNEKESES